MPLVGEERREFQRLRLDPPCAGEIGGAPVSNVEIGVLGSRVRHAQPLPQQFADLHLSHNGVAIAMKCEIVRTYRLGDALESGVRFLAAIDDSGDKLRSMLAQLVKHEFEVRRNMPHSMPQESGVDGDRTVRGSDAAFLCYRLDNGKWHKRRVFLPEQPSSGFTVARTEDNTEMQRLCHVYEASDEEGQRLIRLFAELSVSELLQIPPRQK
ncbi:MAG TPA: PilZ domain-containing protein [Thermoanaerobaculia bacterium]|nr:PilZ domain-containing protein [Thermoanaerobaculia bacterium]